MNREVFRLAWPVFIAQIAIMANGAIDTLMAGRLAAVDLAAVGIGASIYITVFVSAMGVLLAVPPIVAQLQGAGRLADVGEEVRQSAWLALGLSVLTIILLRFPEPFFILTRLQPALEAKVRAYLAALCWSVPASLLFRVFYGFATGIARPQVIMVMNLIAVAFKVPLNWVFMFGHLGADAHGGPGCAISTAWIAWGSTALAWIWCAARPEYQPYQLFRRWSRPSLSAMQALLRLGIPIGGTFFVDVTAFTFMALFIARFGPAVSAAHQIAANIAVLAYMLPLSIGTAASVLAAQALGAGDSARAYRIGRRCLLIALGFALVDSTFIETFSSRLADWYTDDPSVLPVASRLIAIVAAYHLFDGLQTVAVNLLRGYKKTTVPMAIYVGSLWGVGLLGGYLLGLTDWLVPAMGARGFWVAAATSLAVASVLVTIYFISIAAPRGVGEHPLPSSPARRGR